MSDSIFDRALTNNEPGIARELAVNAALKLIHAQLGGGNNINNQVGIANSIPVIADAIQEALKVRT